MIRAGLRLVAIVLLAGTMGLGYARLQGKPLVPDLRQVEDERVRHERWVAQTAIGDEEFRRHFEQGNLVIDARPRDVFQAGHLDAVSIMSVPATEAQSQVERVLPFLGQPIVLYCASVICDDAETLWKLLQEQGFGAEVRVYHPGWEEIQTRFPTATGPDPYEVGYPDAGSAPPSGSESPEPGEQTGGDGSGGH